MGQSGNPAKRAEQEKAAAAVEPEQAPVYADEHGTEDFDAFWSSRKRKVRTTNIMGVAVELPPALPLEFEMKAKQMQRSSDEDDIRYLVGLLFGADKLDEWIKRGMDGEQFAVLLAWAPLAISGANITLAEVADAIAKQEAEGTDPQ